MKFFTSRFMSILLLIPGMFLAQSPAQAGEEINTILPEHVIRVGAVNAPPWYQKDLLTNQWTGLVPDIVQAIFKNTDIKIECVDTQWGTAVAGLQSNRFDILGGFNNTPERAKAVDFTRPMGSHQMGVLTLEKETQKYQRWDTINTSQTSSARLMARQPSRCCSLNWTKPSGLSFPIATTCSYRWRAAARMPSSLTTSRWRNIFKSVIRAR